MTPEAKTILTDARNLIADTEHWCQGSLAQDDTGASVDTSSPDAHCFCAIGAVLKAAGVDSVHEMARRNSDALAAFNALRYATVTKFGTKEINVINDGEFAGLEDYGDAHDAVLGLFDAAIAA